MASGTATAARPAIQATAWSTGLVVGPPRHRARRASTDAVTGWFFAKAWSQPGMVATGTSVELVNTRMTTGNSPARPAASGSVSYTHLRAHETRHDVVCRLLLEKK